MISQFLGSVWFAAMTFFVGYFIAHAFPVTWFAQKFGSRK